MARRPNQPALYELIRDRAALTSPGAAGRPAATAADANASAAVPAPKPVAAAAPASAAPAVSPRLAPGVVRPASGGAAGSQSATTASVSATARGSGGGGVAAAAGTSTGPPLRVLRLPIGYVWIAIGAAVLLAVIAYVAGINHGSALEAGRRASSTDPSATGAGTGIADPLAASADAGRAGGRPSRADDGAAPGPDKAPTRLRTGAGEGGDGLVGAAPATVTSAGDPRRKGWYYYVVAHPSSSRADEMVGFLRDNGLDAVAVRGDNGRSPKVIVLPGFARKEDRSSPEIKALRARLNEVGLKWQKAAPGNENFVTAYPEQFKGS